MLAGVAESWPLTAASALFAAAKKIRIDTRHLAAGKADAVGDRPTTGQRGQEFRFERRALRFDLRKLFGALLDLRIEETQALPGFDPPIAQVSVDEQVDQLLHDGFRQLGIGGIGQAALRRGRADLEQIILRRQDLDRFLQVRSLVGNVAVVCHAQCQVGATHDLLQIVDRRQCLADCLDALFLLVRRNAGPVGQQRLRLHENLGLRLVGVGDEADDEPAEQTDTPGNRKGQTAPAPDAMECNQHFVVETAHARPLRMHWSG